MKFERRILLAKIETTEDTDATPTGAADAILTTGIQPTYYAGNKVSRELDKAYLGADEMINVNPHVGLAFGVEAAGSGAAGTAPAYDPLLQIVGLDPTINAGTDVTYNLLSDAIESCTLWFLRRETSGEDLKHAATGVRGNMALNLTAGQLPRFAFDNMLGSYYTPAEITAITGDFSAFTAPVAVTKEYTATVTVDGYTACMQSFQVGLNNQVTRYNAPNCRATRIADRSVSGQIVIKAPDLVDKNFFSSMESHAGVSTVAVVVEHGTTAGNIVRVSMPTCQISNISETEFEGDLAYQLDVMGIPTSAGNDEFVLIAK